MKIACSTIAHFIRRSTEIAIRKNALIFTTYAETCFKAFGDRVDFWCTVNEPSINVMASYYFGSNAPFIKGDMNKQVLCFLKEKGYDGWIFVEHDTHLQDPAIDLKISRDYIRSCGL